MREVLLRRARGILQEAGFVISAMCDSRCFDFAARRDDITLIVKAVQNIDGVSDEVARSMKRVAFFLLAYPLIVGERSGVGMLEDGVVYFRYGIPAVNTQTLHDYFVNEFRPCVYSSAGGLFVSIDGEAMRAAREQKNLSLGELASALGVSRRSVSKYERGASTTIEIALKLEEILEARLIRHIDMLKTVESVPPAEKMLSSLERRILSTMERIGFEIFTTAFAPFNAVSMPREEERGSAEKIEHGIEEEWKEEEEKVNATNTTRMQEAEKILTGISKCTSRLVKRAKIVSSISEITGMKSVFVVNGKIKRMQIDKTVLIRREELEKIRDADEFSYILEERAAACREMN